ncbi:DUF4870 domain-containing protein [Microbacterium sp. NPDC055910]|uniref:DUF4870 domain-containing protein n=1 Tax=Microbacterium sp. NPDC055910 TaxID=3345659 RepID=UPI0035DDDCB5
MTLPPQPPPPPAYGAGPQPMNPSDEKMWAVLVHLGGALVSILVPLIGYLVLKDRGPFVRSQTATALNFQLTLLIAYIAGAVLTLVIIGIFILIAAAIVNIVFAIIAAVKAGRGEWYQYPIAIRFVS